jgi:hypothetical protein
MIYARTRLRCRRVLEHLFRVQSSEVFESIVDWWSKDLTVNNSLIFKKYPHLSGLFSCQRPRLMPHLNL